MTALARAPRGRSTGASAFPRAPLRPGPVERSEEKLAESPRGANEAGDGARPSGLLPREAGGILVKSYHAQSSSSGREAVSASSPHGCFRFLWPPRRPYFLQKSPCADAKGDRRATCLDGRYLHRRPHIFLKLFSTPLSRVALSPFIVVIAFTMILMSTIVIGLC